MFLALKEMSRAKVRFGMLMVTVALLVFLILFQQALRDGLINTFVGGIRNQDAAVMVYATDGLRSIPGSVIIPPVEQRIRAVDGVGRAGRVYQRVVAATTEVDGASRSGQATIVGTELVGLGSPARADVGRLPAAEGEALVSDGSEADGFDVGRTVRFGEAGATVTIVGKTANVSQFGATLYMSVDSFEQVARAVNPDVGAFLPNVMALTTASGVTDRELVRRVNAVGDDVDALTRNDAADATPGVSAVSTSFNLIFLLYGLVVPLICGLFFLIVTFQKANALTLLRAIGAPGARLVRSLLFQVAVVMVAGLALGVVLYAPVASQQLGTIVLRFDTGAVVFWSVLLLSLALLAAAVSARRVLAIEPVQATTGAGVGT